MGKSAPKYPDPPDPWETASAQGALNQETAYSQQRLNQVDQSTPYGTLTYVPTGEDITYNRFNSQLYDQVAQAHRQNGQPPPSSSSPVFNAQVALGPRYRAEVQLTPEGQALQQGQMDLEQGMLDVGNAQLGRVSDALGQPIDLQGLPPARNTLDDYSADRSRVEDALMQRMQPYLDQRQEQARTRLVNQGFADPASEGYSNAMDEVYRAENDARLAAIGQAGQEQARLQAMDAQRAAIENAGRERAIQERMLLRQTPINEISALTSGTQVALPQFVNTPQSGIQAPDFQGATYASYQGQLANADRRAQQQNAFTQGLFGLGGSALGAFGAINPFGW